MHDDLKSRVAAANLTLRRHGPVTFTWGHVSAIDRARGPVVIKPSGVEYDAMTSDDLVAAPLDKPYLRKHGAGTYYGQFATK